MSVFAGGVGGFWFERGFQGRKETVRNSPSFQDYMPLSNRKPILRTLKPYDSYSPPKQRAAPYPEAPPPQTQNTLPPSAF